MNIHFNAVPEGISYLDLDAWVHGTARKGRAVVGCWLADWKDSADNLRLRQIAAASALDTLEGDPLMPGWYTVSASFLLDLMEAGVQAAEIATVLKCAQWDVHAMVGGERQKRAAEQAHGRHRQGKKVFTDAQVVDVFRRYVAGESQTQIAKRYGVAQQTIEKVLNWKTYNDVKIPEDLVLAARRRPRTVAERRRVGRVMGGRVA